MGYRICTRCVMDNSSDKTITFDSEGNCNYCSKALKEINTTTYFPNERGKERIEKMLYTIKHENEGKKYDCVMGISGGLDSSYLAYLGYEWGLRILAVHIDDGYDTEISKNNIKKLCDAADIELRTITPDPIQYNDLLLSYMKAGVPNLAIPQDNILLAFLFETVVKEKVRYFLSGGNFALESILQQDHVFNSMDTVNIRAIHKAFGTQPIDKLKFVSSYRKYLNAKTGKVVEYRPLNYIDYNRERAFKELNDFCGFEYYGSKHLENIFTAFVQLYWFPNKFGLDKRRSHLSSMIISGQITREDALKELEKPLYDETIMDEYIAFIERKMGITHVEFEKIIEALPHEHEEYGTDRFGKAIRKVLR